MAEDWKAPGAETTEVKYRVIQFASGEWAIEKNETSYIAWFPSREAAGQVIRSLLPANADREF